MKNALITGGEGGIASGIHLVLNKMNFKTLKPSKSELNVLDISSIQSFFDLNKVDLLINNAGIIYTSPLAESDTDLWENVIKVNLFGTYNMTKEALKRNKNTKIINIASMSAYQYFENFSAYASSKAGIVAMTKCLAEEGINAYSICPGSVDTPFRNKLLSNIKDSDMSKKHINSKDMLTPSDIADIVYDILNNKYANGSSILIRKNDIFEVR